ncbi:MAG: hypothetical protein AB7G17_07690 [Phycisphaerales bacterium]
MGDTRRGYVLIGVLVALSMCTVLAATYALSSRRALEQATAEHDRASAQFLARGACVQAVKDLGTALGARWPEYVASGAGTAGGGGVGQGSTVIPGLPAFPPEMAAAGGLLGRIAERMAEVQQAQERQQSQGRGGRGRGSQDDLDRARQEEEAERERQRAEEQARPVPLVLTGEARLAIDGRDAIVWFESESGKVNLNRAPRRVLRSLLMALGSGGGDADALLNRIEDYKIARSKETSVDRRYVALRLANEPLKGDPIERLEMLLGVAGMTTELYERLTPHMTTMSNSSAVDPNYATQPVLWAIGLRDPRALDLVLGAQKRLERITRNAFRDVVGPGVFPELEDSISFDIKPVFTVRARAEAGRSTGRYMIRVRLGESGLAELVESREGWL